MGVHISFAKFQAGAAAIGVLVLASWAIWHFSSHEPTGVRPPADTDILPNSRDLALFDQNPERPMVAYGISNTAGGIDYCIIEGNGKVICYELSDFIILGPRTHSEQWVRKTAQLANSELGTLKNLLSELPVEKLQQRYHGNKLDGTQQYLALLYLGEPTFVYFDNLIPPIAEELIGRLKFVRENVNGETSTTKVTHSEADKRNPFSGFP